MADFLPPIVAELRANISEFSAKMREAKDEMDELAVKGESSGSKLAALGKGAVLGLGAAAVGIAAFSIDMSSKMDSAKSQLESTGDVSDSTAKKISDAFTHTGMQFTVSGDQIVAALAPVSGQLKQVDGHALTTAESVGFMTNAVHLAEAAHANLADTTKSLASVLQVYGIDAKDSALATDTLWNASKQTAIPVDTLAQALNKMHGRLVDSQLGLTQSAGLLDLFAEHGQSGTRAVGALTTALNNIYSPSKSVATELGDLGIKTRDAAGNALPFTQVIQELHDKFKTLTPQAQDAALKALSFGNASSSMLDIIRQGPGVIDAAAQSVGKSGSAADAAEKATNNLKGQMERLEAGAKNAAIIIGEHLVPMLEHVVNAARDAVEWLSHHRLVLLGLAGAIASVVVPAIALYIANMIAAAAATIAAAAPILLIAAAVGLATVGIYELATHWKQVWSDVKQWVHDGVEWIKQHMLLLLPILLTPIGPLLILATHFRQIWTDIRNWTMDAWRIIRSVVETGAHAIEAVIRTTTAVWRSIFNAVFPVLKAIVQDAWTVITSVFRVAMAVISPIVQAGWAIIKGIFELAFAVIKTIVEVNWDVIKAIFILTFDIFKTIVEVGWTVIRDVTSTAMTIMRTLIQGAMDVIRPIWQGAWEAIHAAVSIAWSIVQPIWDLIKSGAGDIGTAVQTMGGWFSTVFGTIGQVVQSGWSVAKGVFAEIKRVLDDIAKVAQTVGGAIGAIGKGLGGLGGLVGKGLSAIGLAGGGPLQRGINIVGEQGPEVIDWSGGTPIVYSNASTPGGTRVAGGFGALDSGSAAPSVAAAPAGGGGTQVLQPVYFQVDGQTFARVIFPALQSQLLQMQRVGMRIVPTS